MDSDLDTLANVQASQVPRPTAMVRDYPVELEAIVMKALAKRRVERFATARELACALRSLPMGRSLTAAPSEVASYLTDLRGRSAR